MQATQQRPGVLPSAQKWQRQKIQQCSPANVNFGITAKALARLPRQQACS